MGSVTARIGPVTSADKPTGHVASLRLPMPLGAMRAMNTFLDLAYGKDATLREEPEGWLKIEVPVTRDRREVER